MRRLFVIAPFLLAVSACDRPSNNASVDAVGAPVRAQAESAPRNVVEPLRQGEALPDAELINQDGKTVRLSDYRGAVLVVTFIYTRCNLPSVCPMVTGKFKEIQDEIARRKIASVRLLIVSFDAAHDRPDVLREFAQRYRADLASWDFATGTPETVGMLARRLNVYYRQDQPGIYDHNAIVAMIDKKGILRDDFCGAEWKVEDVASVIAALAEERSGE